MNLVFLFLLIIFFLYFISISNNNIEKFAVSPSYPAVNYNDPPEIYGYTIRKVVGFPWTYEITYANDGGCLSKFKSEIAWTESGYNNINRCYNRPVENQACASNINCPSGLICSRLNGDITSNGDSTLRYCLEKPNSCKALRTAGCIEGETCKKGNDKGYRCS
jgi:hypothetical protein